MDTQPAFWLSYLPRRIVAQLLAQPGNPAENEQQLQAVALFADIAGFTAVTEAFTQHGKQDIEQLTLLLNRYFGAMIDLIRQRGGIIGKFGGDAITALFPYQNQNRQHVVRQATQCALDMQIRMAGFRIVQTPAGESQLGMKVGLAMGAVRSIIVGDPAVRLEYMMVGSVLERCAEAEHHASQGQVVAHADLLPFVGRAKSNPVHPDFVVVEKLERKAPHRQQTVTESPLAPHPSLLAPFLPKTIAERLSTGQTGFINEHRRVTTLFVGFGGFEYDADSAVSAKLQTYFSQVIHIIERYGGYLNKVDVGDKGSKYIILFGAPVAYENDGERALRCALELITLPATSCIGINTGFVYCGQVGSAVRQEYTMIGDAANLAARLMQAAQPKQILVGSTRQNGLIPKFQWRPLPPIQVKGKSELVVVHELVETAENKTLHLQEPTYTLPMVGRQAELAQIETKIKQAQQGQGQLVGITAEAGMGKSRLAAEAIKVAIQNNLVGYSGECQSYGTYTHYLVWHNVWRGFFGLEAGWPVEQQMNHLHNQLTTLDPALVDRMPLLAPTLNLPIPDTPLTQSLVAKARKSSLETMLSDCLRARASKTPVLLVLEDCHWMDALSVELLEEIGRVVEQLPVLVLLLYRPVDGAAAWNGRISQLPHFTEIPLPEFTDEETEQLIELRLQSYGLQPDQSALAHLKTKIVERAQGNPFYIDEMIGLLRDQGSNLTDIIHLALPDSLHSLIISRIDQLNEAEKTTLKVASVIGRVFKANWLWGVYPQVGLPGEVKQYLSDLSRRDLTPLDKPEPELEYLFKHIVTRDVAYESLSVVTRELLHQAIGEFIEQTYPNELDRWLDLLAHHYGRSRHTTKQRHYFRRAADAARTSYANQAAIEYYQRLLPLLPTHEQPEVWLLLGEVQQLVGRMGDAEHSFDQAYKTAESANNLAIMAQSLNALSTLYEKQSNHTQSLIYAERALHLAEQTNNLKEQVDSLRNTAYVHESIGKYDLALQFIHQAQLAAEQLQDQVSQAHVHNDNGRIHWRKGNFPEALSHFQQASQVWETIGYLVNQATVLNNTGNIYFHQNEYSLAVGYYTRAWELRGRVGDRFGMAVSLNNLGAIAYVQGEYEQALVYHLRSLALKELMGDKRGIATSLNNIAEAYWRLGDFETAESYHRRSLTIKQTLGDKQGIGISYDSLGCLAADQGNLPEALTLYHRALAVREEIGEKLGIIGTLFHLGTTHLELGQLDEATTHLERATQLCQAHQIGSAQMMGVVYLSLVQLARSPQQTADILQQLNWAWEMLQTNELEAEHVPPLYFDLYKAFLQLNDPKARAALQKAHDALTTQAAKIQDTTMKERFLQVPLHKQIVAIYQGTP